MKYNTITKAVAATVPGGIYEGIDYHGEPPADVAARAGWVDVTPEIQVLIDADKAAQDAANAAAQAEYLAGVDVLPRPVRGAFESLAPDGHVYGLEIDPDGGEVIPVQRESTRLTQAEYDAAKAARLAERAALRAARAASQESGEEANTWAGKVAEYRTNRDAVTTQLNQYADHLAQLETILTTGPDRAALTTAIAALTGVNKTAAQKSLNYEDAKDAKVKQLLNDLKAAAVNLKQAVQDLKQATNAALTGK
jgi:hypothetical protein